MSKENGSGEGIPPEDIKPSLESNTEPLYKSHGESSVKSEETDSKNTIIADSRKEKISDGNEDDHVGQDPDAIDISSRKMTKDSSKISIRKTLLIGALTIIGIAVIISAYIMTTNTSLLRVDGNSMSPTLNDGEWVVFKGEKTEKDGNIIFFDKPSQWDEYIDRDTYLVKRIIALPNDVIEIKNGILTVSGKEKYDLSEIGYQCDAPKEYKHTLTKREIMVVGDNISKSLDSLRIMCNGSPEKSYIAPEDMKSQGHVQFKIKGILDKNTP